MGFLLGERWFFSLSKNKLLKSRKRILGKILKTPRLSLRIFGRTWVDECLDIGLKSAWLVAQSRPQGGVFGFLLNTDQKKPLQKGLKECMRVHAEISYSDHVLSHI